MNSKIISVVKQIAEDYPDTIFCDSFGLVLNGLLQRYVNDLDILTVEDHYGVGNFYEEYHMYALRYENKNSHKFMVGKDQVLCFPLNFPNGIKVDVLYNENTKPKYREIDFHGTKIKIENPESAIDTKLKYIENDKNTESVLKHLKDLIFMGVENDKLNNALKKSYTLVI